MLLLERLQHIQFLLLVARRLPNFLLPLVVHHLLHHRARLSIQVTQLAILRRDLARVDLRCRRDHMRPPFHLVDLVEMYRDFFTGSVAFERPGGFVGADVLGEIALAEEKMLV